MTKDKFKYGNSPFKYGVFIVIGDMKFSDIYGKLNKQTKIKFNDNGETLSFSKFVCDNSLSPTFERIVCISYNGNTLEYKKFDDIIKSQI